MIAALWFPVLVCLLCWCAGWQTARWVLQRSCPRRSLLLADRDTDPEWIMAFNAALDELDREFPNGQIAARMAVPVVHRYHTDWAQLAALTLPDLTRPGGSESSAAPGTLIPMPPKAPAVAISAVARAVGGALCGTGVMAKHLALLVGAAVLMQHTSRKSW